MVTFHPWDRNCLFRRVIWFRERQLCFSVQCLSNWCNKWNSEWLSIEISVFFFFSRYLGLKQQIFAYEGTNYWNFGFEKNQIFLAKTCISEYETSKNWIQSVVWCIKSSFFVGTKLWDTVEIVFLAENCYIGDFHITLRKRQFSVPGVKSDLSELEKNLDIKMVRKRPNSIVLRPELVKKLVYK